MTAELILKYLTAVISCMMGVIAFSAMFHAPHKEYISCGIAGTIGWIIYLIVTDLGGNLVLANFLGTVALTLFCRFMSVIRRTPVTVYLVPGIFPLVPGAGIYYTAYFFVTNQPRLGAAKFIEILKVAGAISMGILFGSFLISGIFRNLAVRRDGRMHENKI